MKMKRIIVVFSLIASIFMIMVPSQAESMYIDLISQSCDTSGSHFYVIDPVTEYKNWFSWNESGTTSVFGISPIGEILTSASADVGESTASLDAWIHTIIYYGTAYAEITFRPIGASYINISASAFKSSLDYSNVKVIDETTSESLLYFDGFDLIINGQNVSEQYNSDWTPLGGSIQDILLPVEPTHIYFLSTWAWVDMDKGFTRATANIDLVVPIPTTIFLLGSGLVGLVGLRRKLRKK